MKMRKPAGNHYEFLPSGAIVRGMVYRKETGEKSFIWYKAPSIRDRHRRMAVLKGKTLKGSRGDGVRL